MKLLASLTLFQLLISSSAAFAANDPSPLVLLKNSDRSRGAAAGGVSWQAKVDSVEEGNSSSVTYAVKVKGNDALVEAVAPARNKGETMLFNDRNLWFFKPGLRKPVAISPRQKLMGQAANGDIASTNYARDYEGKVIGQETVNGKPTWKLELKAKAKNVTYDQIRYWITRDSQLGIKAEFLTVSGQIFKRAEFDYSNQLSAGGKAFPFVSRMKIVDAANPANQTILIYQAPKSENHSSSLFNVNNLIR